MSVERAVARPISVLWYMNLNLEWFAIRTRSKFEKAVAKALTGKGYEILLPTSRQPRLWAGRRHIVELPLFPGYAFCRFHRDYRLPILQTPGVVEVVGNGATPVEPHEIEHLRTVIVSGLPCFPSPMIKGDVVRVAKGPLRGVEGVFIREAGGCHVVVAVTLLQRGVFLEVEAGDVEAVSPQPRTGCSHDLAKARAAGSRI
jgi:transcription termination/antitermination protein NusG